MAAPGGSISLVRDTAISAASTLALTAGRLLLTLILARALSQEDYGRFIYGQWIVDMSMILLGFNAPGLLTRFLPDLGGTHPLRSGGRMLLAAAAISAVLCAVGAAAYGLFDRSASLAP